MASASVVGWASTGSTMTSLELYTASTWPGGSGEQRGLEAVEGVSEGSLGRCGGEGRGSGWGGQRYPVRQLGGPPWWGSSG